MEPFDAAATGVLLERVLGAPAAPSLRDAIFDRTDGVPFFVTELGLALAASERLRSGPAGLELLAGEDLPLPDSVRDAVLLRASGLSDEARAAIAVAVAGQSFDVESVMAITGLDEWPDELLRRVPGRGPAGDMAFRHALVRDAFYGDIPWLRRRDLHGLVAERLQAAAAPAPIVAEHWSQAREGDRARRCFLAAADAALRGSRVRRRRAGGAAGARAVAGRAGRVRPPRCARAPGALAELAGEPGRRCGSGVTWSTAVAARATPCASARQRAGSPARSRPRDAGRRRSRRARRRRPRSRPRARRARRRPSGSPPPRISARPPASAPRSSCSSSRATPAPRAAPIWRRIMGLEGNVRARMGEGGEGLELVRAHSRWRSRAT